MKFKLHSKYTPSGDQPEAIEKLVKGLEQGEKYQTLLGVTGSGKTFTMASIIEKINRPALVLSHNKTLTAQLYGEFKQFFPENAVEYFVSYYDYYQPEAYIPVTNTYIEKDLSINEKIERLRLKATSSLLSGRRDVIVVASVSCIYGIGNPETFKNATVYVEKGQMVMRKSFLMELINALYVRTHSQVSPGTFRVAGDVVEIMPSYSDFSYRIIFFGNEVEEIELLEPSTGKVLDKPDVAVIFPSNLFVTPPDMLDVIISEIKLDLFRQIEYFESQGKMLEARRIEERVNYDLEMIKELGYCSGIENYSRYFDRRNPGQRPFCLLDYFPPDYITFIDESHVTVPQIRGMYSGDISRKKTLVEYGFRLPAALDNRPLNMEEFESLQNQVIFVSATPGDYELEKSGGVVVEQVVRPTGLLDPEIEVRPSTYQIDDLLAEIKQRVARNERILVVTLTKRMSEELSKYLLNLNIRARYLHSEIDTIERIEILRDLRLGKFDVLVGINLLREGLDLPEVSLVAILDADKEGFLRSETSLTQIAGRAARHSEGKVIMYADRLTGSMERTIRETNRRRAKQKAFNEKYGITPRTIKKSVREILDQTRIASVDAEYEPEQESEASLVADPVVGYMNREELEKAIRDTESKMKEAAKNLEFILAARYRDEINELKKILHTRF